MSVNRPTLLATAAATISAACVVAMAGTAFALEAHRPPQPVVSAPTSTPAASTHPVATTPAIAPTG
jgi:hypothetical protein